MTLTYQDLRQFTGTENYYRYSLVKGFVYTDGVRYLAQEGGAYWLLDKIFTLQIDPPLKAYRETDRFQVWKLKVNQDKTANLSCENGNGTELLNVWLYYTDFPLPEIDLYLIDNVLLLPSEY